MARARGRELKDGKSGGGNLNFFLKKCDFEMH